MLKRFTSAQAVLLIAAAIIVACAGDRALIVSPQLGGGAPPLGVVTNPSGAAVSPIQRETPLDQDTWWSFDVGPDGASVHYPSVGLTIDVPPGAVAGPTRITCVALKGAALAYRFEPHGLQFAVPIHITQSLRGLKVGRSALGVPPLFGGYFADDSLALDAAGEARVLEILPILIDVKARAALLDVRHFSGYTVASAERDSLSVR